MGNQQGHLQDAASNVGSGMPATAGQQGASSGGCGAAGPGDASSVVTASAAVHSHSVADSGIPSDGVSESKDVMDEPGVAASGSASGTGFLRKCIVFSAPSEIEDASEGRIGAKAQCKYQMAGDYGCYLCVTSSIGEGSRRAWFFPF